MKINCSIKNKVSFNPDNYVSKEELKNNLRVVINDNVMNLVLYDEVLLSIGTVEETELPPDDEPIEPVDPIVPPDIPCTALSLDKVYLTVVNYDPVKLTAIPTPSDTTDPVTWSSMDPNIATVDNDGLITPKAMGETLIVASCGSYTAGCSIQVNPINDDGTDDGSPIGALYIINKTIRNVSYSNSDIQATRGDSYSATFNIKEGCELETLSIKMNTVDITERVFDNETKTIYIPAITGHLDITIIAVDPNEGVVLDNPTIELKDYKAVLTQDGHSEKFNISYGPNSELPNYANYVTMKDDEGYSYYLSLASMGDTQFRVNQLYPTGAGWHSDTNSNGEPYTFHSNVAPRYNNWSFEYSVQNVDVEPELVEKALACLNTSFDALNITTTEQSNNLISYIDAEDTWLALCSSYYDHFTIVLNTRELVNSYGGRYGDSKSTSRMWLSTVAHEFGHTLGIRDNATHLPSLYSYSRDRERALFFQANDLACMKDQYLELFGINVETGSLDLLEKGAMPIMALMNDNGNEVEQFFDYEYFDSEEFLNERASCICEGKLQYLRNEVQIWPLTYDESLRIEYKVFKIIPSKLIKGEVIDDELKIPAGGNLVVKEDKSYLMYLSKFDHAPCSLLNTDQGFIELPDEEQEEQNEE